MALMSESVRTVNQRAPSGATSAAPYLFHLGWPFALALVSVLYVARRGSTGSGFVVFFAAVTGVQFLSAQVFPMCSVHQGGQNRNIKTSKMPTEVLDAMVNNLVEISESPNHTFELSDVEDLVNDSSVLLCGAAGVPTAFNGTTAGGAHISTVL